MVMALEVARQRGAFLRGGETSPAPWLQADGRCVGSGSGKITAATRGVGGGAVSQALNCLQSEYVGG